MVEEKEEEKKEEEKKEEEKEEKEEKEEEGLAIAGQADVSASWACQQF